MLSRVKSIALHGLEGYLIEVQVDASARNAQLGDSAVFQILVLKKRRRE